MASTKTELQNSSNLPVSGRPDRPVSRSAAGSESRRTYHHIAIGDHTALVRTRHWLPKGGTGPLLFAVHALTGSGLDFAYLAEKLAAAGWRVIAPDLPGHGASSRFGTRDAYSLGKTVRVLDALHAIYATDGEPASFLGSSLGSGLVASYLAAYKVPARAVILNDNALENHPFLQRYLTFLKSESKRQYNTMAEACTQLVTRNQVLFRQRDGHKIDQTVMLNYLESQIFQRGGKYLFRYDPGYLGSGQLAPDIYPDFFSIISSIRAERIMLMFGEHSPFKESPIIAKLQLSLTNIVYREIPDAGHAPRLLTDAEVEIVRAFLEGRPEKPAAHDR